MCQVACASFSSINQSAYSTLHWMSNSQSEYDGVAYAHYWKFPINGRIIPILTAQLTAYPMQNQWSCRKNSTIGLFQMSVFPKQGSSQWFNCDCVDRYWPTLDDNMRRAAFERGVQVKLLASIGANSNLSMIMYLRSLDQIDGITVVRHRRIISDIYFLKSLKRSITVFFFLP